MSEWLKPSVQMPHENGEVLCAVLVIGKNPFYVTSIDKFHNDEFYDKSEGYARKYTPDLWMPIPKLPKID